MRGSREGEGAEMKMGDREQHHHHHCKHLLAEWMGGGGETREREDKGRGKTRGEGVTTRAGRGDDDTHPIKHPQPLP
jgi:hypothetical protein